jgi:ATP adenylyltransferase
MEQLWAPWRMKFIQKARSGKYTCIFCEKPKQNKDEENLILFRGKKNYVIMNIFPYNNGHVMVAPYRHAELTELTDEELLENQQLVKKFVSLIKKEFKADGFNTGANIGKLAGAGFEHMHTHIVPRWSGDSNFMPIIADTKVFPEMIEKTYRKLKKSLK